MRLKRLHLVRYGHFTDHSFELPPSDTDFHIVFGPNEAGKSTALSAIEDLLFGIPVRSPYNFRHNYASLRIGAVLENGRTSLEVVRRKGRRDTLLGSDNLPLPGGETALQPLLAGADRPFFQRMFSLDHVRLESGGREILEAEDDIGQMLFSAGAGLGGLPDLLEELTREADELWAPRRARHRKYYQARDRLEDAGEELRRQTLTANRWQESKKAYERTEEAYGKIESEFERLSAESRRLSRIRRVYHDVCRMADLKEETDLADLEGVVPLPADARGVLEEAERRANELSTRIDTLSGHLVKAREELETLDYDERLILRDRDIKHLHERRIEVRREKADLPKRQAELEAAEAELRGLSTELGWRDDIDKVVARIPPRTKLRTLRSLIGQRGRLASDVENRTDSLREAQVECDDFEQTIEAIGTPVDVSGLRVAIKMVRESGDVTGRVRRAAQELKLTQDWIDRLLAGMNPPVPDARAAAEMRVPPEPMVQAHRDALQDWERRSRDAARELETAEEELERARRIFRSAVRDEQVVSVEVLQAAREDRDALWRRVKIRHISNRPTAAEEADRHADAPDDPAAAFEPAMRHADDLADRRFDNAEAAGRLAEMSRSIEEQTESVAQMGRRKEALLGEGERLDANWQTLWEKASISPLAPDIMLEWLRTRNKLLEADEERAEAAGALAVVRAEEREAKEGLMTELSSIGAERETLENHTLPLLLERSEGIRFDYEQEANTRERFEDELKKAEQTMKRRRRELDRAEQRRMRWRKAWSDALTEVGLKTGSDPDSVSALIDVMDQIREKSLRIDDLRYQRIGKINRDIEDFEAVVAMMVENLAPDLAGVPAEDAVLEIENRLTGARRIRDLKARKEQEIEELDRDLRVLEEKRETARGSVNYLKDAAGVETSEELRRAIEKSDSLRAMQIELGTVQQMLEQQGDGLTATELEEECEAVDLDRIVAREDTTGARLKRLQERLASAAEERAEARRAFQAIGGDSVAARAESTRQEALVELSEISERYVRVQTSALLLQWAIDRYRREKQAPLLKRAGQLFATITGGSFTALGVDYDTRDKAHLTGLRPSGEVVRVPGMSSGTADQLYLALRIASMEDYLEHASALPFVADDLFVNFDNDRAQAGFRVLGRLAENTQVLFFTHHWHLLQIARETLGSSISAVTLSSD